MGATFDHAIQRLIRRLPRPVASVLSRLGREDLFLLSAALAFYALVSVVPFAILVLWLLSALAGDDQVQFVADQLARVLPPDLRVNDALQRIADIGTGIGVSALVTLVWPATAYGSGLSRAFGRLCPVDEQPAKGLRGRALALSLVVVIPVLILAGLVASYAGSTLVGRGMGAIVLGAVVALLFGFLASTATAAVIYRLFSPQRLRRRALLTGAATAGASIAALSAAYTLFLRVGTNFEQRYAFSGLAAIVLLAFWLFLSNALVLVGYQVAREG